MVMMALITFSSPAMAQQAKKSSAQRRTTTVKKTTTKKSPAKKTATKKTTTANQPVTVNSLKNEQLKVRKQIEEQQRKLKANERDVKKRLQNLLIINNEIADKRKSIDTIRHDINRLDGDITTLKNGGVEAKKSYVSYCARCLNDYFLSVKKTFDKLGG